jgi:hypothetical protein
MIVMTSRQHPDSWRGGRLTAPWLMVAWLLAVPVVSLLASAFAVFGVEYGHRHPGKGVHQAPAAARPEERLAA